MRVYISKGLWGKQYLFVGLQRTMGFFSKCCKKSTARRDLSSSKVTRSMRGVDKKDRPLID